MLKKKIIRFERISYVTKTHSYVSYISGLAGSGRKSGERTNNCSKSMNALYQFLVSFSLENVPINISAKTLMSIPTRAVLITKNIGNDNHSVKKLV